MLVRHGETQASMAFYGDSFTFYMQMMFAPHRKHTYGPPRPAKGIALLYLVNALRIRDVILSMDAQVVALRGIGRKYISSASGIKVLNQNIGFFFA
jgi:hypothetical protein